MFSRQRQGLRFRLVFNFIVSLGSYIINYFLVVVVGVPFSSHLPMEDEGGDPLPIRRVSTSPNQEQSDGTPR